jgi:3-oxoadipate enol-lactonase/4-carboxymuconolactone decarboxylase
MPFATRDGIRLYWRLEGAPERPALFLLGSIGTDMSLWDRLVPRLLPRFRVLRMDARGHGASDAPAGDYDLDMLADDAIAVMDAAGVAHAIVCGLSLGGMIAMTLALRAPARVRALICACTSSRMDRETWRARVETVRAGGMAAIAHGAIARFFSPRLAGAHADVVETVRNGLLTMSATGYAGCAAAIRDMTLDARLGAVDASTLVICGERDISTPFEGHGDRLLNAIPGASLARVDAGHLACVEDPGAFAGALLTFAAGLEGGDRIGEAADILFDAGLINRRAVLGDAWVDRSLAARTPFNADFQAMITRYAWQEIWGRPGLDHRTRRLLVIAITAALGRWEEFRLHVRAGLTQGGFTKDELKEVLMQTAIYAGVPAANTAFAEAAAVIAEVEAASAPLRP